MHEGISLGLDQGLALCSGCVGAMAGAKVLAKALEKEKLIRKRFRIKKGLMDFPPAPETDDAEKAENPISTRAMEMNCTALQVMVKHYKVLSGKKVPITKLEASATCP